MERMRVCQHCREGFELASTGRPPRYCSATCRKKAWEARRLAEAVAVAVAKAVAAEQRRASNRGNETPQAPDIRGNETPPQARAPMQPPLPAVPVSPPQAARPSPSLPPGPSLRQRRRLLPPPPGQRRDPEPT